MLCIGAPSVTAAQFNVDQRRLGSEDLWCLVVLHVGWPLITFSKVGSAMLMLAWFLGHSLNMQGQPPW